VLLINPYNPLLVKKIVKPLVFAVISIVLQLPAKSQIRLPTSNPLGTDIRKVIREYPHQFSSLQGNIIQENPQTVDYECIFKVSGAESSSITKYSARNKMVYSWQALMLTTEDFEEAKKKFKSLYSIFNHLAVKMDYGDTFYLSGHYEEPVEEKSFSSSVLTFEKADKITHKMKLEVSLQYEMPEWKVRVIIYERDREDNEQGDIIE
jgi:hypothetical protein